MTDMFELADKLKELRDRKAELAEETKANNAEIEQAEFQLSQLMASTETQNFQRAGTLFYLTTKTYASKRKIAITPIVKHVLDSALRYWVPNPMELLFYDYPNNSLVHPGEVTSYIKRICKKYRIDKGWDVNFHMLRHTFATRCIESGMSAKVLQKKLGHKKIDTTLDTYTSVFAQFENQQDDLYTNYLAEQDLLINL